MNQTEKRYAQHLAIQKAAGLITDFRFEAIKLRLAHRTWYMPDFLVVIAVAHGGSRIQVHEVKGWMRDDARVKINTAAQLFPELEFVLVRAEKGGGWRTSVVCRHEG
jgi:hypothetical protein